MTWHLNPRCLNVQASFLLFNVILPFSGIMLKPQRQKLYNYFSNDFYRLTIKLFYDNKQPAIDQTLFLARPEIKSHQENKVLLQTSFGGKAPLTTTVKVDYYFQQLVMFWVCSFVFLFIHLQVLVL